MPDCDIRSLTTVCWNTWTQYTAEIKLMQWSVHGVERCLVISGDISTPGILQRSVSTSMSADSVDTKLLQLHNMSRPVGTLLRTKKMRRRSQSVSVWRRRKQPRETEAEREQDHLLRNISMRSTAMGNVDSAWWLWNLKCRKNISVCKITLIYQIQKHSINIWPLEFYQVWKHCIHDAL